MKARKHSPETIEKMRRAATGKRSSSHGFHVGARLCSIRKNAFERGIEWALDDRTAKDLIAGECRFCGHPSIPIEPVLKKRIPWTLRGVNGIDRLDSSQGYTTINCVSCCSKCNLAKRTMTVSDFIEWIEKVRAHLSSHPF